MPTINDRLLPPEGNPIIKDPMTRMKGQWAIFVLAYVAWIFSTVAVTSCALIKVSLDEDEKWGEMESLGLFKVGIKEEKDGFTGCVALPHNGGLSGGYKSGRAFGIFLMIAMTAVFLLVNAITLFIQQHQLRRVLYLGVRIGTVFSFVSNLMTFTAFSLEQCSEDGARCPPGPAGIVAIFNIFVLAVMTVLVFVIPCPNQCAMRFVYDMDLARTQVAPPAEPSKQESAADKMYRKPPIRNDDDEADDFE